MSKKVKILCVYDSYITEELMSQMKELEEYGAEVTMVRDNDMQNMGNITDRMLLLEQNGVDAAPTCEEMLEKCKDQDILVVHCSSINKEIIEACPNLKVAAVLRGGYENADVDELTKRKIPLINAPWRSSVAVADFTVGMMIAENKNIARSHQMICEGKWCKSFVNQSYIHNMDKCTVGLIGYGYIGSRVVKRLKGFECKILVYDPFVDAAEIEKDGITVVGLDELLAESDFVSMHLRLSEKTTKFMGKEEFGKMKETAYFINTARSGLVDTDALVDALKNRKIGGAAVDVYDVEPMPKDHPYLELDNITLTSHLAGTSCDTPRVSVEIGVEQLKRYLKGEPMQTIRNL